jgi:hypothetical protein
MATATSGTKGSSLLPSAALVNSIGLLTLALLTFKLARFLWDIVRVYIVNRNGIDLKSLGDWAGKLIVDLSQLSV